MLEDIKFRLECGCKVEVSEVEDVIKDRYYNKALEKILNLNNNRYYNAKNNLFEYKNGKKVLKR